jgi:hypothetical protein
MISVWWRAFFYLGPIMLEPGLHQGIVPFPGIDGWLLRTPSQRLQSRGEVVRIVAHPQGYQNHRPDAQKRPPIRLKTSLESAFVEDCQHALPRLNVQAAQPAGNRTCVQAGRVALMLTEVLSPCADGRPTDAQSAGNVSVGELSDLEKPAGFQASFSTLTTGEVSCATDHGHLL